MSPQVSLDDGRMNAAPVEGDGSAYRLAVVGSGPRGMSVLERVAARLLEAPPSRPVEIYLIDAVEVGCGRIWRTDQPEWFLMNTVCGEVTMFSGPPDDGPSRPGAGPSLAEWWSANDPDFPGRDGYAPRALHGRYMRHVLDVIDAGLPARVVLHRVAAAVEDLCPVGAEYRLTLTGTHARRPGRSHDRSLALYPDRGVPGVRRLHGGEPRATLSAG
jgi:methylaspartate mutase epsilon subunit